MMTMMRRMMIPMEVLGLTQDLKQNEREHGVIAIPWQVWHM